MGETSPDSVFANYLLDMAPSGRQNSSAFDNISSKHHHHHHPYLNQQQQQQHHQQQQQQQQSTLLSSAPSSSYHDLPFANLPSQRSISAPLESNYVRTTDHSDSNRSSFLWGEGLGEGDMLDQVTSQVYDLSLGATATTDDFSVSLPHHQPFPRINRSTSAFGSEAEMISHHQQHHHHRSGLSFLEEERGATAPPSSNRFNNEDVLWSSSSSSSLGGARNNNSHWMMEQSGSSTRSATVSNHHHPPPLAAVRPAAKTLMELIQEQDPAQSFLTMNQQQVQQQQQQQSMNDPTTTMTNGSSSRLMGPPGYPVQPEQRWVLESNTPPMQPQQQQQQQLQQPHRAPTMTTTMYQLQPRTQQVILGNPTGDFRYVVPAPSYNTTTAATTTTNPSYGNITNNHHSYVSVMPIPQQQQPPPPQHNVYWQQQQDHHNSPPSPHYGRSRGPPQQQQRRRMSQPRSGRNSHSHHPHHPNDYNNSCAPIKQLHQHHHIMHQPSVSPPRSHNNHCGSSLLEEFRNSKRSDWTIPLIVGHIVEFCQDQNGSRFIQQRLELGDSVDLVLNEVLPSMHILRIDVFGNYVVQKLLDFGTPDMKMEIRNTLEGEMVSLSLQMYGCRVVQKALEALPEDQLFELLKEFHHNVLSLIHDQNGNHVIQKCVEVLNSRAHASLHTGDTARADFLWNQVDFIVQDVLLNARSLSCHPYGCRVFQRMLEHCREERKLELLDKIYNTHSSLLDDQYGNYVIQHVLQFGRDDDRNSILNIIEENGLLGLSRQKFASNVVEKLLKYGNSHHRRAVIREMLKKTEDPALHAQSKRVSIVLLMVRDAYANYVVQTTLDVAPESPERRALLYELNSHVDELRNYTFAKHIVAKLTSTTSSSSPGR